MQLTFLGTRANIDQRTKRHFRHAALLAEHVGRRVLIDCGRDWLGRLKHSKPDAIVVTHAHPDHAFGLQQDAICPVYATKATWDEIKHYPIADRNVLRIGRPTCICGLTFEAFAAEHSLRAPAVGCRMSDRRQTVFYCPDLARIRRRHAALSAYIGDGSAISRHILKKRSGKLIGHASIRNQLEWCRKEGIPRAIFTHCGNAIVTLRAPAIRELESQLTLEFGLPVRFAWDGQQLLLS